MRILRELEEQVRFLPSGSGDKTQYHSKRCDA